MPSVSHFPRWALMAGVDLRAWAGTNIFKHGSGGSLVALPAWTGREGLFRDALAALNGRSAEEGLSASLDAKWQAAGGGGAEVSISLNTADRIVITNTSAGDTLTLDAHADNAFWGLDTAGFDLVGAPSASVTATSDWQRGLLTNGLTTDTPRLRFSRTPSGGGGPVGTWYTPSFPCWVQDISVALRNRGTPADIDEGGNTAVDECIEALDNATSDNPNARIRHGIYPGGYHFWTGYRGTEELIWSDADLAAEFGWPDITIDDAATLGETGTSDAVDVAYQISPYPIPGVLAPTRAMNRFTPGVRVVATDASIRTGARATDIWRADQPWTLTGFIDGPIDSIDLHMHWIERCFQRLRARVAWFYPEFGDSRRWRPQGWYTHLYTPQLYRGRIPVYVDADETAIEWRSNGEMTRAEFTLELRRAEAGI